MRTLTLKDAQVYFSSSGELGQKLREAAKKGLFSAALRAKRDIVSRVIPSMGGQKPIDRGIYRAGWQVARLPTGAAIYNPVPHAAFVENGVPPGNSALSGKVQMALAEWVQRKLGGRRKGVSVDAMRKTSQSVNKAKERFEKSKATWAVRAKKARERGAPEPPKPKPPAILSSKGRIKHDFGAAWEIAGAIMHAMHKRGIFARGKGLRVLETYARATLPSVIKQEVERELAKVQG